MLVETTQKDKKEKRKKSTKRGKHRNGRVLESPDMAKEKTQWEKMPWLCSSY